MASRIYLLGGSVIAFGLVVLLAVAMLLAAALDAVGGQITDTTFWVLRALLLATVALCFGVLSSEPRSEAKFAIAYLVGAVILSYGLTVAHGYSHHKVLAGLGCAFVAPSFLLLIHRREGLPLTSSLALLFGFLAWDVVGDRFPPSAVKGSSEIELALALIAVVLGLTRRDLRRPLARTRLWDALFLIGLMSLLLWNARDATTDPHGVAYAAWLSLMAIPIGVTLMEVLRWEDDMDAAGRLYVAGGWAICFGVFLWFALAPIRGVGGGGIQTVLVGTFWSSLALVFAMGSVCFGLLGPDLRPGTNFALGYVVGAATLSVGAVWTTLTADRVVVGPSRWVTGIGFALVAPSFLAVIQRSTSGKARAWAVAGSLLLALAAQIRC